jgi:hypothetical protein
MQRAPRPQGGRAHLKALRAVEERRDHERRSTAAVNLHAAVEGPSALGRRAPARSGLLGKELEESGRALLARCRRAGRARVQLVRGEGRGVSD